MIHEKRANYTIPREILEQEKQKGRRLTKKEIRDILTHLGYFRELSKEEFETLIERLSAGDQDADKIKKIV